MILKINTNIERFEKELSIKDKIKNLFNFKKIKKQLNGTPKTTDEKEFIETLIIDEILEE